VLTLRFYFMTRSLLKDILHGSIGLAGVSIAAFSVWAFGAGWFRHLGGELGMYAGIAVVFLGLSGLVLGSLAGRVGRFYRAFLPAFTAYAATWCGSDCMAGSANGLVQLLAVSPLVGSL
jgi:hypothetical protein